MLKKRQQSGKRGLRKETKNQRCADDCEKRLKSGNNGLQRWAMGKKQQNSGKNMRVQL